MYDSECLHVRKDSCVSDPVWYYPSKAWVGCYSWAEYVFCLKYGEPSFIARTCENCGMARSSLKWVPTVICVLWRWRFWGTNCINWRYWFWPVILTDHSQIMRVLHLLLPQFLPTFSNLFIVLYLSMFTFKSKLRTFTSQMF